MAFDEATLHPQPPPPISAVLSIPLQLGCHYAEDSQQPSTSHHGGASSPPQAPAPMTLDIPQQPGCYYAQDSQQPSTSRHQGPSSPLRDHYTPEDFQANPDAMFQLLLERMLSTEQDMDTSSNSDLEWMDELLRNLDATSQQGGHVPPEQQSSPVHQVAPPAPAIAFNPLEH